MRFGLVFILLMAFAPLSHADRIRYGCIEATMSGQLDAAFTEEAMARVNAIFEDPKIPDREKALRAMEIYYDTRMSQLPPDIRKAVETQVKSQMSVIQRGSPQQAFNGVSGVQRAGTVFSPGQGFADLYIVKIDFLIPEQMVGTPLDFALQAHELEHAIANVWKLETNSDKFFRKGFKRVDPRPYMKKLLKPYSRVRAQAGRRQKPWWRYREEVRAMKAEWNYLRSIPKETKLRLLYEIESTGLMSRLSQLDARTIEKMLTSSDEAFEEYLHQNYLIGRYRAEDLFSEYVKGVAGDIIKDPLTLMSAIGVAHYQALCALLAKESDWIVQFCLDYKKETEKKK